ncbi:hypothetical protein DFH08DRAFT_1089622 [Mycena albidolilacea]|uniref:Uncharacterized protein n=1 Tax=Mycena albidolilacea TaxID=1033008 RepID=A0AAD6Z0D1_9AGAR|nr:hypothetical protein DFH08DRAFT_1089622 [Mycena albidolilacea]
MFAAATDLPQGEIKAYRKFAFPSALSDPAHSPFFSIEEAPSWITSHGYQLFLTHNDSETATSWDLDDASTKQLKAYRSHMVSEYYRDHPFFSLENTEAWISLIPFQVFMAREHAPLNNIAAKIPLQPALGHLLGLTQGPAVVSQCIYPLELVHQHLLPLMCFHALQVRCL